MTNQTQALLDLLDIRCPIIQGGMAWAATANLAAAVSNAGGLGQIGSGSMDGKLLEAEIIKLRELTDRPFGVNLMLMNPHLDELVTVCIEQRVPVVTTGAGSPGKYIPRLKEAGIKVIPVVASAAQAKRVVSQGADAVVCEGQEAGGHIGQTSTMTLLPSVTSSVDVPVIGAGGFADGRGLAAAIMLGAAGIQMGTRFLCAEEAEISPEFKALVLKARDIDTVVTGRSGGHPVRSLRSSLESRLLKMEQEGASQEEIDRLASGALRKAVLDGDLDEGAFMAGESAALVNEVLPAAQILMEVTSDAAGLIRGHQDDLAMYLPSSDEPADGLETAIVTGASRGIGKAVALRLAAGGYSVVFAYRSDHESARETLAELETVGPAARHRAVQADVGSAQGCQLVAEMAGELGQPVTVLVNNAAINRDGLILRMSEEQFNTVLQTDLTGPFLMIKAVVPLMMKQRRGRIVNISSVSGLYGNAGQANYAAAKAGVIGLTKTVAREFASRGVTCNAVAPGFVDTDMTRALPEKTQEAIKDKIMLGRFGEAEDIAAAVSYLASPDASYITGQVIEVSGGLAI